MLHRNCENYQVKTGDRPSGLPAWLGFYCMALLIFSYVRILFSPDNFRSYGEASRRGLAIQVPVRRKTGSSLARDRGEALCQAVAPKRLNDEIDEHACLGRQQRARGVIDRDRSAVAIPLRQEAHECAALEMR